MANSKSALKRIRQNEKRRSRNRAVRSEMRTEVKRVRTALAEGDAAKAAELLPAAVKTIDVTAKKKVIHSNAAARSKSRLVKAVRKAQADA